MLNKIRVGEIDQNIQDVIKLYFIDKNDPCYPGKILHIFAENAPAKIHNHNQLKHIPGQLITRPAKDEVPKNSKISDIISDFELDDKCAGQIRMNRSDVIAKNNKWVPVKREETSIYLCKYKSTSPAVKRTQFPLVLSWSYIVHKVQGLSLTSA